MAAKVKKQPVRTCVACRISRPKKELVRIVRSPEGRVFVDPTGKANGRGAYVCPSEECLEAALSKRKLEAALEVKIGEETARSIRSDFSRLLKEKNERKPDSGKSF